MLRFSAFDRQLFSTTSAMASWADVSKPRSTAQRRPPEVEHHQARISQESNKPLSDVPDLPASPCTPLANPRSGGEPAMPRRAAA
jgi:hypothetical protein